MIAVVVDAVADFFDARRDGGVGVVAVHRGGTAAVTVGIRVDFLGGNFPVAVVVRTVADFPRTGILLGLPVIAISVVNDVPDGLVAGGGGDGGVAVPVAVVIGVPGLRLTTGILGVDRITRVIGAVAGINRRVAADLGGVEAGVGCGIGID